MPGAAAILPGLGLVIAASPAAAHPAAAHLAEAAPGWTLDPWITGPLLLSAALFALGMARLWRRSAAGRPQLRRRAWLFGLGWLALAGALTSPLHEAGEQMFSAHMLEHELLMLVAAPLLVLSWPIAAMLWAFPTELRQGLAAAGRNKAVAGPWRFLAAPVPATVNQAAALWLWHLPGLFDLALRNEAWHAAQHLSFLVTSLFFWTAMLHGRRSLIQAAGCLFFTSVISGALGALMALSHSPWYARYAAMGLTSLGLTAAEDQQLAGLLMWIPGGLVHAVAALALLGSALRLPQRTLATPAEQRGA